MFNMLMNEAALINHVSSVACEAYRRESQNLLDFVISSLEKHPNIPELTGRGFSPNLIDNQKYHLRFMTTVFHFNNYQLLCRVLIWFYHTCRNRGYSADFFPVLFAVWQRAVDRHLEPETAAEINRIYQWMMSKNETLLSLSQCDENSLPFSSCDLYDKLDQPLLAACQESLLNGDYRSCVALLENSAQPQMIEHLYCNILQPCLYSIGDLWALDEIDVASEHLATATAVRIMQMQYARISASNKHNKGTGIISAVPGEYHSIGANMVSDLLELDNWQTYFLGGNTPQSSLLALLRSKEPFLLGLSVVMPFNLIQTEELIRLIREDEQLKSIKILLGGPRFLLDNDLWQKLGADAYACNAKAAVQLAAKWWQEKISL